MLHRRDFVASTTAALLAGPALAAGAWRKRAAALGMDAPRFGLVTYLWGRDLALADLLAACAGSGLDGVELRTTHAHGVEPGLDAAARAEVRARFAESPVTLVGLGSNERFDSPDPSRLAAAKKATIEFLRLSAEVGGGGVKVKPDSFHPGVERPRTIEQISGALRELAPVADDLGQEIRLEVHGGCADPRVIRDIVRSADHPAVRVCWNSNPQDLRGLGFRRNYDLLRPSFGGTLHVRELDDVDYPFQELVELVIRDGYDGFVLLEAHSNPPERREAALAAQRTRYDGLVAASRRGVGRAGRVTIEPRTKDADTGYEVRSGDEPFATLRFGADERTPAIFPLFAPGGLRVLRAFPFERIEGESEDHPHHRGLWFAHGDVDGHDFWHDPECRIVVRAHEVVGGDTIRLLADWATPEGVIATETRTLRFSETPGRRRIDFGVELTPTADRLVLGDTKEGTIALRLAPTLRVEGPRARGRLENGEGLRDGDCWGRRSSMVTAEGPVEGRLVRVAMVDATPGADGPTHWHARKYGLLAANPFGRRAFEGREAPSGRVTITPESPFRRRIVVFAESGIRR